MKNTRLLGVSLLLYSESLQTNKRIATFTLTVPKFIQAQINSHRALSRNSGSSRAIPSKILRTRVLLTPYIPLEFSSKKSGMRGGKELSGIKLFLAKRFWLYARYVPCFFHYLGEKIGIHKEILNRLIEPWMWTQVVITATEWRNFLALRENNDAQPEMKFLAKKIRIALDTHKPITLNKGDWHLPFVTKIDRKKYSIEVLKKIAVARCARISYKAYDGSFSSPEKDIELCNKLISSGHWSPFEHIAVALPEKERSANFIGFKQYRKYFPLENGGDYE